ncbi:hypothetical protein E2C01_015104 [Portunus trituberculatus]|uniref:Uncharacterized protein n=1 Tax=Portunus trituberculatus TaxID=210409 RepID=A0A5B7DKX7_PORTR|nr:hypothetical protein [Portunus trituberculatus]
MIDQASGNVPQFRLYDAFLASAEDNGAMQWRVLCRGMVLAMVVVPPPPPPRLTNLALPRPRPR